MAIGQNPSTCNNLTHCFLAEGVSRQSTQHLDASEDIEVVLFARAELEELMRSGEMLQALMAAPIWRYLAEHPA